MGTLETSFLLPDARPMRREIIDTFRFTLLPLVSFDLRRDARASCP